MIKGLFDNLHKKLQNQMVLSEEESILLLTEMILSRNTRPKGWFRPIYQPAKIDERIRRILIIPLSGIGDLVYTTPVISGLKERFKGCEISLFVEEEISGIMNGHPLLKEVIPFPKKGFISEFNKDPGSFWRIVEGLWTIIKHLRELKFDLVINLHLASWNGMFSYLSRARNQLGLIIDEYGRSIIKGNIWMLYAHYLHYRAYPDLSPLVREELQMRMSGLSPGRHRMNIYIDDETKRVGQKILDHLGIKNNEPIIGINPGANSLSRRWGEERFSLLADKIIGELRMRVIIFGAPHEKEMLRRIAGLMNEKPLIYMGEIKRASFLLSRCRSLITNDTGPMYIAGAVGTPVICICGPTLHQIYGEGQHILIQADVPNRCNRSRLGCSGYLSCKEHLCMKAIDIGVVLSALMFQLGKSDTLPYSPGIRFYYQDGGIPKRLHSYSLSRKMRLDDGSLAWEVLKILMLNLWIKEDQRYGGSEEFIEFDETKTSLSRLYETTNLKKAIDVGIKLLSEYEALCREGIRALQAIYDGSEDEISRFNIIEKEMNKGVGRIFNFLYFLFLKEGDEIGWRINLYREMEERSRWLKGFLYKWRKRCQKGSL